ncbi:glutathione S-transferase N-terminal domain-containing protein [Photobacterium sp. BZF1]|uniref:glutathione S-transferase N-terminal domain-containing protein n=1 Tax=Photobacterium sp. BZF1 TaxID=1904457 RepID=UPI001653CBE1|nr:glutathione S-transferase N-terminal domain-containing protein [Photobacterium sp. BZF1]MBC7003125.1 glutathione S-transferase N-terminal domain-containing protein [Photobacterium sp. BZF1]
MNQFLNVTTSLLASTYRCWQGTVADKTTEQPEQTLMLFDQENDAECRQVREALTKLNLDILIVPCPKGGKNLEALKTKSGKGDNIQPPVFVDNNQSKAMQGAKAILKHLNQHYGQVNSATSLLSKATNEISSTLATTVRLNVGSHALPSNQPELPLILYSFESSPYARPVREKLCELELPYILINLGKQQVSDMGPATMRWSLKPYQPLPNTKREAFFKQHGNVQVPFLMDPNTHRSMFESTDIVNYLEQTYQQ